MSKSNLFDSKSGRSDEEDFSNEMNNYMFLTKRIAGAPLNNEENYIEMMKFYNDQASKIKDSLKDCIEGQTEMRKRMWICKPVCNSQITQESIISNQFKPKLQPISNSQTNFQSPKFYDTNSTRIPSKNYKLEFFQTLNNNGFQLDKNFKMQICSKNENYATQTEQNNIFSVPKYEPLNLRDSNYLNHNLNKLKFQNANKNLDPILSKFKLTKNESLFSPVQSSIKYIPLNNFPNLNRKKYVFKSSLKKSAKRRASIDEKNGKIKSIKNVFQVYKPRNELLENCKKYPLPTIGKIHYKPLTIKIMRHTSFKNF